jgi:hypothetical protein
VTSWHEIEADSPEFAKQVRALFQAGTNKTLATLRHDGSPRISGTELEFRDGDVVLGMMPQSRKLHDVLRDPRVAIHSPTLEPPKDDPSAWPGDAKFSGTLRSIVLPDEDTYPESSNFALEITEVVWTYVEGDNLIVESWHPVRGWTRFSRK